MRICADELTVELGSFRLDDISIQIPEGCIFSMIGETGSGKSVLLGSLAGFYEPAAGRVTYNGKDVRTIPLEDRRIGYVYQDNGLFPHMSVERNIEFGLKMHRINKAERRKKVKSIMELLAISHLAARYPGSLSGGEQQRTALARALVLEPEVLFMDEPFSALDPNTKHNMYALIRDVHRRFRCTIIFVTHDFNEAQSLADRVGIMVKGRLRCVCSSEALMNMEHEPDVAGFLGLVKTA